MCMDWVEKFLQFNPLQSSKKIKNKKITQPISPRSGWRHELDLFFFFFFKHQNNININKKKIYNLISPSIALNQHKLYDQCFKVSRMSYSAFLTQLINKRIYNLKKKITIQSNKPTLKTNPLKIRSNQFQWIGELAVHL